MTLPARERHAARITIGYAAVAALWIALSDRMLVGIADPALAAQVSTFKGFAFVAVTASLLYLMLRFGRLPEAPVARLPIRQDKLGRLVAVFLALSAVIAVIGFLAYRIQAESVRSAETERLNAIAELKVGQIVAWLAERRGDALSQARSSLLVDAFKRWRGQRDAALRAQLVERLAIVREVYDYASVELLGPDGGRLLAAGETLPESSQLHASAREAASAEGPIFVDLQANQEGSIRASFMAALRDDTVAGRPVVGIVVLSIDPQRYLFPLIQSWPGPSASAETLLVRREGDDVLFLNELRHRKATTLNLRLPLHQSDMPSVRAILYGETSTEGRDYRGEPVLAALRTVPGTPWHLVAKIDKAEVFQGIENLALTTAALALAVILGTGLVVALLWRQQRLHEALALAGQARALTEAEARFRATFEQAAVGLAHVAPDGRWLQVNERLCAITGYGREELLARKFQDITHPDDLATDLQGARHLLSGEIACHRAEKRYLHKDGSAVWISLTVSLVRDAAGEPDYFVVVVEDIAARKAAEARVAKLDSLYRTLSETNQAIVRVEDEASLFRQTCEVAIRLGNFSLVWVFAHEAARGELVAVAAAGPAAAAILGLRVSVDEAHPTGRGPASRAFRSGRRVVCNDFLQDPDTALWHEPARRDGVFSTVSLPLSRAGKLIGTLNIAGRDVGYFDPEVLELLEEMADDVSFALGHLARQDDLRRTLDELREARGGLERRVQERTTELRQALARAEAADRAKSAFLATMSHELRTPLNSVLGFTGILLKGLPGPLNDEQTNQLTIVRDSARHLLALINDVLDISRIEAGEMSIQPAPCDLRSLLERAGGSFASQAAQRGLSFEVELEPALSTAWGDPRRVEQVLNNLLSNALKFTEQGGVRLVGQVNGAEATVAVEDTGIGIAPHDQERLFQPFVQVDGSLTRAHEGTGLGLAISRRLVEAMGGSLSLVSVPDLGSTFTFTLPLRPPGP